MEKWNLILLTLIIETILFWFVSILFGWSFINTIFLGGIFIFGCAWFYKFYITPRTTKYNTSEKDWIEQDTDIIKVFHFLNSPFTIGIFIFLIISFIISIIAYILH